jgi:hypothetical protein
MKAMNVAAQLLMDPSAAPLFGAAGLVARMASPLFGRRDTILFAQLAASCCYATSYALLDQKTAAGVCIIGAMQNTVAMLAGDRSRLSRLGYVFIPAVLVLSVLTFSGLPTVLAATACCLMMIGRLQQDLVRMRAIQLGAGPFGAAHDFVVGNWPCLAGALLSTAIAAHALRRHLKRGSPA